jgi:NAD+ kinase
MRVAVVSRLKILKIRKLLERHEFRIVNKNPDFVLCYGGDGTILFAERKFPLIPKLIIKKSRAYRKYDYSLKDLGKILVKIKNNKFRIRKEMKLRARYKKYKVMALNEIQVHNKLPTKAIRFSLFVDGKAFDNLVGDGVIISTPFGSTGYYLAAGGKPFKKGIGVCFNNLYTRAKRNFVAHENAKIEVKIGERGGLLINDNDEKFIELKKNDVVFIEKAKKTAQFIEV